MNSPSSKKKSISFMLILILFVILLIIVLADMLDRNQFNMTDYLSVILGILGFIVTLVSWREYSEFRRVELELRDREVSSREGEVETARERDESRRMVCKARIRGMLESWLSAGPDYGFPIDPPYLDRLSKILDNIDDDCISYYTPIEDLKADLNREISALVVLQPTLDRFEGRVRELVRELTTT